MKNKLSLIRISGFTKPLRAETGFTLLEITIVIVVLAILASFTIPRLSGAIENQRVKQGVKILYDLYSAQKRFALDNNNLYTTTATDLDTAVKINPLPGYTVTLLGGPDLAQFQKGTGSGTGEYTLTINASGTISCTPTANCTNLNFSY